jgi:hypothetical protein
VSKFFDVWTLTYWVSREERIVKNRRKIGVFLCVALAGVGAVRLPQVSALKRVVPHVVRAKISTDGIAPSTCQTLGVEVKIGQVDPVQPGGEVVDPSSDWISNEATQTAIDAFWKSMDNSHIDVLGGHVDFDSRQLVVIVEPDVDSAVVLPSVERLQAFLNVEVKRGCRSKSELENAVSDISTWVSEVKPGAGISMSIDELKSAVLLETDSMDFAKQIESETRLRQLPIEVLVKQDIPVAQSRCADAAPHYGGARFGNDTTCSAACTSAFKVRRISDGAVGMSTAGHCRETTSWSGNLYSGYSFYGAFADWHYGGGDDWAFIVASSYSPNYYTDPCCPSVRTSAGAGTPAVGNSLCISGYVTGARCSMIVQNLAYQNYDPVFIRWITNVQAIRSDGTVACQPGDSGGTWFSSATSKVFGIHSFGSPTGGPVCYFNQVSRMLANGFQVMTS